MGYKDNEFTSLLKDFNRWVEIKVEAEGEIEAVIEQIRRKVGEPPKQPEEKTKPSVNWDHVAEKWKWLAQDGNGSGFLFDINPFPVYGVEKWVATNKGNFISARDFSSFTSGTCDWCDSLVKRPD